MSAFETIMRARENGFRDELLRTGGRRQPGRDVGQRCRPGQCPEWAEFHMRMPAAEVIAIMRANLERECAIGGRHEADRYHGLKEQRDQQHAGEERAFAAIAEISRHRTQMKVRQ